MYDLHETFFCAQIQLKYTNHTNHTKIYNHTLYNNFDSNCFQNILIILYSREEFCIFKKYKTALLFVSSLTLALTMNLNIFN